MNRKTSAIISILFTIFIAVIGLSAYLSGQSYMTFLGIELSQGAFIALIIGFILLDFIMISNASKGEEKLKRMINEAAKEFKEGEKLESPCTIKLTRTRNFIGSAFKMPVYLNGNQVGLLKNGKTIEFNTHYKKNQVKCVIDKYGGTRSIEFESEPSGQVELVFDFKFGNKAEIMLAGKTEESN